MNISTAQSTVALYILLALLLVGCQPQPVALISTPNLLATSSADLPQIIETTENTLITAPTPPHGSVPSPITTPQLAHTPTELPSPEFVAVTLRQGMPPPDGAARGWVQLSIEVYQPPKTEPVFRLSNKLFSYNDLAFSPDGCWMAYVEDDVTDWTGQARVRLISTDWQTDRVLTDWFETARVYGPWLRDLSWSPDGHWLTFKRLDWGHAIDETYIIDVQTGELRKLGEAISFIAWSPQDPTLLAFSISAPSPDGGVYVATAKDLDHIRRIGLTFRLHARPGALAWNPAQATLAMKTCEQTSWNQTSCELWLVDTTSETKTRHQPTDCGSLSWSPDGHWLACEAPYSILFLDTTDWQTIRARPGDWLDWKGQWWGNTLFVYEKVANIGGSTAVSNLSFDLVAVSVEDPDEWILWSPRDVGLPERIEGKFSMQGISWHMNTSP